MLIPGLPEMSDSVIPFFPGQEREVNDLTAGFFNSFLGLGQVLAPTYGSFMTETVGFRLTVDIVAIFFVTFGLIYFVLGDGPKAFRSTIAGFRHSRAVPFTDDYEKATTDYERRTSFLSAFSEAGELSRSPMFTGHRPKPKLGRYSTSHCKSSDNIGHLRLNTGEKDYEPYS